MRARRPPHPLEHHPSFRAVIAAAPPLAELASRLCVAERSARVTPRRAHEPRATLVPRTAQAANIDRAGANAQRRSAGTEPGAANAELRGANAERGTADAEAAGTYAHRGGANAERGINAGDLVGALAIACGDLADGFAAPPASRRRITAHHRAWIAVREIDRAVTAAARRRLAPPEIVQRAQRAIDRADVLIGALLPA